MAFPFAAALLLFDAISRLLPRYLSIPCSTGTTQAREKRRAAAPLEPPDPKGFSEDSPPDFV